MPGHYHAAPSGAFGKKKPLLPIPDPQAACIWAPINAGISSLVKAEHVMTSNGCPIFTIKFVTPKVLKSIQDSYKLMGTNVTGPVTRLVDALARVNARQ